MLVVFYGFDVDGNDFVLQVDAHAAQLFRRLADSRVLEKRQGEGLLKLESFDVPDGMGLVSMKTHVSFLADPEGRLYHFVDQLLRAVVPVKRD